MAHKINRWKENFATSERGKVAKVELEKMWKDPHYLTQSSSTDLQGNHVSFVKKHLIYLRDHPLATVEGYISNLRLMTKSRKK